MAYWPYRAYRAYKAYLPAEKQPSQNCIKLIPNLAETVCGFSSERTAFVELSRFAFSTHAYTKQTLQHALTQIAAAGFKAVEILADKPHAWLDTFTATDHARLIKQLDKLKLSVSSIDARCTSGFWSDPSPEPVFEPSLISRSRELREWRIAYCRKALRLGKAVDARNVTFASGRMLNGVPPELARTLLLDGLKRLIDYADKLGQRFSLACDAALFIEKTDELAALVKTLHSKIFGAALNVGHAAACGEDPSAAVRKLAGHLFHVELADIRAKKRYPRVPGEGELNFRAIFAALNKAGYDGALTWNLYAHDEDPDAACKKTIKYLKRMK